MGDQAERIQEFQASIAKRIQLKVIKALRDWMKGFWAEDFLDDKGVQEEVEEWLKELKVYNEVDVDAVNCVWMSQWAQVVEGEYRRLKSMDWKRKLDLKWNGSLLQQFDDVPVDVDKQSRYLLERSSGEEVADQLTLLDYQLFIEIEPRECVHQRWKDADKAKGSQSRSKILCLIQQFNNFTIFIQIQILKESSLKKRALALKRIIKMGEHFRQTRNYNSLCAVFSALNSAPIHRLKLCWQRVPEKNRMAFQQWSQIFSRDGSHRNLRQLLRRAGGNPCIPHIGLFLQDLVFIDEGNQGKYQLHNFKDTEILNFNKCVRVADRIKNLQLFQKHKYSEQIKEKRVLQKVLLLEFEKLKDVTEDQIWDMSTEIKKQDAKTPTRGCS